MSTLKYTVSCVSTHYNSFHLPNPLSEWDRPFGGLVWNYFNAHTGMTPDNFFKQVHRLLLDRDLTSASTLLGKLPGVECGQTTSTSVTFRGGKGSVEVSCAEDDMLRVSSVVGSKDFEPDDEDLVVMEIFRSLMAMEEQ